MNIDGQPALGQSDVARMIDRLNRAMAKDEHALSGYRQPKAALMLETLRAIDALFCSKLLTGETLSDTAAMERGLSSWGCNAALALVMPERLLGGSYEGHPSHPGVQAQADDLLFRCGTLASARRVTGWLKQGLATASLVSVESLDDTGPREVLEVTPDAPTLWDEGIGLAGLSWEAERLARRGGRDTRRLEREHRVILPELTAGVTDWMGWGLSATTSSAVDAHFMDWARLHLEGMYGRDLLDPEDRIGGRSFSAYVEVLTALCARGQRHLAHASILARARPELDLRNLLTTWSERTGFIDQLAGFLDGDRAEVEDILQDLTLSPASASAHLSSDQAAWAPIVQVHEQVLFLPLYGLETNPFTFLMRALRTRFEREWFQIANTRERRWAGELTALFDGPRWTAYGEPLILRDGKRVVTDIDFAVHDKKDNILLLFQLKWQHPVFGDDRARRSACANLVAEGCKWVSAVTNWLEKHGVAALQARLSLGSLPEAPKMELIVIGRYAAHFTGSAPQDARAHWADWANFRHARLEGDERSLRRLLAALDRRLAGARRAKRTESLLFPVADLAVAVNAPRTPQGYRSKA